MFDNPERFERGFRLARRFFPVSEERVELTLVVHQRPEQQSLAAHAPAQKSTTISLRVGATSNNSSWLPSYPTSMFPLSNENQAVEGPAPRSAVPAGSAASARR
ncbi:MAG: hypothetical protein IPO58_23240 [Betaproteobacteria bacterium]|nr:hypothetical protein [Betaproteobacteria bacterium]